MVGRIEHPVMTTNIGWSSNVGTPTAPYAIRRRGLQAEIQHVVKSYIIDHRFRPGDPLPGEGELARQLGISRPSLREAMKVLQTIGVIETRHGSGTYVGALSLDAVADGIGFQVHLADQRDDAPPEELLDLMDLREAIEKHLIRRVAGRHTGPQIARMRALNDAIARASVRPEEASNLDSELHMLFYEPLCSRMKSEFVQVFLRVSSAAPGCVHAAGSAMTGDHAAIIDALAAGNRDAAEAAMTMHLRNTIEAIEHSYQAQGASSRSGGIAPVHTMYAD